MHEPTISEAASSEARRAHSRELAIELARALHDAKCEDVAALDVYGLSQIADALVIASGTSERQMRTAIEDAEERAQELGETVFRRTVHSGATWLILDLVDVVVHVFEPNARAYYDLEMLWGDGERMSWRRPGQARASTGE